MLGAFKKIHHYHSVLGPLGAATFIVSKLAGFRPLFKTSLAGIKHPFQIRIGTTDASVMAQVLLEKHYDLPINLNPKVIIDAGANIGLSALYFANKFPEATIIALEPEESNFKLLEKNVRPYPQIRPVRAALWGWNKELDLIDPSEGHHGFQTVEGKADAPAGNNSVAALTLDALLAKMNLTSVDLLKIDIEGSEKEVFENSSAWIDKVGVIMIELHENLKPGCTNAFVQATKNFPAELSKGETVMRARERAAI